LESHSSKEGLVPQDKDFDNFVFFQLMMDHVADRPRDSHWDVEQINTVRFLQEKMRVDFSKDEINHVIGLLEVNAFEVKAKGRGRGVFPLTALMSHSCIANTRQAAFHNPNEGKNGIDSAFPDIPCMPITTLNAVPTWPSGWARRSPTTMSLPCTAHRTGTGFTNISTIFLSFFYLFSKLLLNCF
jgi:hypothetical protein